MQFSKKDPLVDTISRVMAGEKMLEENFFYRLPSHVIHNELFVAARNLDRFYNRMKIGNDFDLKEFNSILKKLKGIQKEARKFNKGDKIPLSYE
jgi:hypothetical protein